jgi:hypothetical protein
MKIDIDKINKDYIPEKLVIMFESAFERKIFEQALNYVFAHAPPLHYKDEIYISKYILETIAYK